jgi:actin-like ATPase involved in cell morphogenesis
MKEEKDLAEATVGEEAAMAAVGADMGEGEEEAMVVVEVDTAEGTIGAVGIVAMNEIVAQSLSKRVKKSK